MYISLWMLLAVGCERTDDLRYSSTSDPEAAECISIASLKSLGRGESLTLNRNCHIEGWVVANDLYGEFEQSLVVEDESGGIEVQVEGHRLYRYYPIGLRLRIFCEGLALGEYGGKWILGAAPTGEYVTDRIAEQERERYLHPLNDPYTPPQAMPISLGELRSALIGRYVVIRGVRILEAGGGALWCEYDPLSGEYLTTTRHLTDTEGRTIDLYCPAGCTYASEPLPEGLLDCYGILDYFNEQYQLRIVNRGVTINSKFTIHNFEGLGKLGKLGKLRKLRN